MYSISLFLFIAEKYSIAWTHYILSIYQLVDRHLDCFWVGAMIIILLGTFIYKSLCDCMYAFLLGRYLGMELLGCMPSLTFYGTAKLFSEVVVPFYILISNVWGFWFLHFLTTMFYFLLHCSQSRECGMVPSCSFNL